MWRRTLLVFAASLPVTAFAGNGKIVEVDISGMT